MNASNRPNITFVRALEQDVDEIISVQNAAFAEDVRKYGECPAVCENRDVMLEWMSSGLYYKMLSGGEIIGTMDVRERSQTHYHLRVLSVRPDCQNTGVGSAALQFLFTEHPDVKMWTLITPKDNVRNCHFYEKAGFKAIEDRVQSDLLTLVWYQRGEE